jgi:hypothetical protein
VRRHVHPTRGIVVRVGQHGPVEASEDKVTLNRRTLTLTRFADTMSIDPNKLECDDEFDDVGEAQCTAYEGGFAGRYWFLRESNLTYLLALSEESH